MRVKEKQFLQGNRENRHIKTIQGLSTDYAVSFLLSSLQTLFSFPHCHLNSIVLWFYRNPPSQQGNPVEMKPLMLFPTWRILVWVTGVMLCINWIARGIYSQCPGWDRTGLHQRASQEPGRKPRSTKLGLSALASSCLLKEIPRNNSCHIQKNKKSPKLHLNVICYLSSLRQSKLFSTSVPQSKS